MAASIPMPELSPGLEAATLSRWLVAPGDMVEEGDVIAEVRTDKAVLELEAPQAGQIDAVLIPEGTKAVAVGTPLATLVAAEAASGPAAAPAPAPAPDALQRAARPGAPQITQRDALRDALSEEMERDDTVFVIGEEVGAAQGAYKVTQGLIDRFGKGRVVDAPALPQALAGLAVGAAMAGLRPVVEVQSFSYLTQAMDQIVQSAAMARYRTGGALSVPLVVRGPHGGAGQTGAQHSQDMAAWFAHVPGLRVVAPYDAADAKGLLKAAIRDPDPVIFLEDASLYGQSFDAPTAADEARPLGQARTLRPGRDVTLVSFGIGMLATCEAADILARDGIEAEVIDLRSLRPLDTDTIIGSVMRTHRCVTIEQGWPQGGIGQQIATALMQEAFDWLDAPVLTLTGADVPMPYAAGLEAAARPGAEAIVAAARRVLNR